MNDLALIDSTQLWSNPEVLQEIKNIYAKGATDTEFATFVGVGKSTGLNPFRREIWFIKFGNNAAQIMIARDGYRSSIGNNQNYESHLVDAVYENDEFEMDPINNKFAHRYNLKNRGKLVGAYCLVFMRNASRPYYVFCELQEYDLKQSLWKTKPATMIKKCAEAQCIRMADPNRYNGTYSEDELPAERSRNTSHHNANLGSQAVKQAMQQETIIEHEVDKETLDTLTAMITTSETIDDLKYSAEVIRGSNLPDSERSALGQLYKDKLKELKDKPQDQEEILV